MKSGKGGLVLFLLILCAIIVGGFLGEFLKGNSLLGFLSWGFPIGSTDDLGKMKPLVLNLRMLEFSFGLVININLMSISTLILALYIYTRL